MPDNVGTVIYNLAFRKKVPNDNLRNDDGVIPTAIVGNIIKKSEDVLGAQTIRQDGQVIDKCGNSKDLKTLVAIGVSTGGPRALQEVLKHIPHSIPAAILIVQHMPTGFTKTLAERLNAISGICVKEAEDGEIVRSGYAYMAPGDYHMRVVMTSNKILRIVLSQEPPIGGLRPSVNVMMNSIAETRFPKVVGVIMTGMGADGSEGIVNIKKSNSATIIAQDEKSCVVYGMPKSAVKTGCVDVVVPLNKISEQIVKYVGVE